MIQALQTLLPMLYLACAFVHGMHFGGPQAPRVDALRRALTGAALLTHAAWFASRAIQAAGIPTLDPWSTLSAVVLASAAIFSATSWGTAFRGAGAPVFGLAALLQLIASAQSPWNVEPETRYGTSFYVFHALTGALAAAAIVLSGLFGALYLWQFHAMRRKEFGPIVRRMPDLQSLSELMRRAALAGFLGLGIGVNFGIGWAHYAKVEGFRYTDPYVLVLILLWLHFGLVAGSRRIPGFSARRASIAAAAGLSLLAVISLVALNPTFSFHWKS